MYCQSWNPLRKPNALVISFDTEKYWVFGLCPSSGILEARKHNVPETGSVTAITGLIDVNSV
jgi:hypothetical protein